MPNKKKVGFIGLGDMGFAMACCLLREGFDVVGFDLRQAQLDALRAKSLSETNPPLRVILSRISTKCGDV